MSTATNGAEIDQATALSLALKAAGFLPADLLKIVKPPTMTRKRRRAERSTVEEQDASVSAGIRYEIRKCVDKLNARAFREVSVFHNSEGGKRIAAVALRITEVMRAEAPAMANDRGNADIDTKV